MHTGSHANCGAHRHWSSAACAPCQGLPQVSFECCNRATNLSNAGTQSKTSQGSYEILTGTNLKCWTLEDCAWRLEVGWESLCRGLCSGGARSSGALGTDFRACFKRFPQRERVNPSCNTLATSKYYFQASFSRLIWPFQPMLQLPQGFMLPIYKRRVHLGLAICSEKVQVYQSHFAILIHNSIFQLLHTSHLFAVLFEELSLLFMIYAILHPPPRTLVTTTT